ncbi:DNA-3-methyladenine glycosylase II [Alkalibacterium sp. AK22]|uniref:DNA-3-methyladenine glycosylase n=1 Tax=Alkalibacterium sp. AK22 TaxID=1229520 RepID=UPI0004452B80|nr:DNA-3-methyladenine glycosylase [Alkalibacterium sp. AK22]EXJ24119.1 DNA-3-methyladenine glycosylase II [Alkalibacterium sp. AK22]
MTFLKDTDKTTKEVAESLLGCLLVTEDESGRRTSGWIVETEAYLGVLDQACHTFKGRRTPKVESMFQQAGTLYLYQMHTHKLLNVVTRNEAEPEAVLIRAVEPYEGIDLMEKRRQKTGLEITNGPGKLTKAMGITMEADGSCVDVPPVCIDTHMRKRPSAVDLSSRIGVPGKGEWTEALLRYTVKGNPYVSRKRGKPAVTNGWV